MVSKIAVIILNQTLEPFIDNLDFDQLDVGVFKGTIKLENLSIKKTIINELPFPFQLEYGYVGKIFADIPIINIGSSPVKIEISNIFVLLKLISFHL